MPARDQRHQSQQEHRQTRPGPVGPGLPRAAEQVNEQRQAGRRRAQRAAADPRHLLPAAASTASTAADLRNRFRWMGLYTQRKEGIPGGQTATLEPEELDAEFFMMRIRIDGGALTSGAAARRRGASPPTYGRDVADVSDRQNVQLHWIRIEDVPEIWQPPRVRRPLDHGSLRRLPARHARLPAGGRRRRLGPRRRSGAARDRREATSATRRTRTCRASSRPPSPAVPGTAPTTRSTTCPSSACHRTRRVTPGFDLWVGGGLSTNPHFAERVGVFVRPEEVSEVWAGVVSVFRDWGYRRQRNHARLKFLISRLGCREVPPGARRTSTWAVRCPTVRGPTSSPHAPRPHRRRGAGRRPASRSAVATALRPDVGRPR